MRGTRPGQARFWAQALAFVAAALPLASVFISPGPRTPKLLAAILLAVSALRPAAGWVATAALAPLGALAAARLGAASSLTEPVVLAFLAGWLAHEASHAAVRTGHEPPAADLALGLAPLFGVTVVASLAVHLAAQHVTVDFPAPYLRALFRFLWHDYLGSAGAGARFRAPITPAFQVLEAVALFVAAIVLSRRWPRLGLQGARALAAGAAATAAAAVYTVIWTAAASGWDEAFPAGIASVRLSSVGPDVNAAGSYYALALGAVGGLILADRRYLVIWGVAGILALAGLWMTGSRIGLAAPAIVAIALAALAWRRNGSRAATLAAAGVAAGLVILAGAYLHWTPRTPAGTALEWRLQQGATALRMFAAHPVFGVGVGRFYALSPAYASPGWGYRENAHNNFLQVLAELGLLGLGLLVALLACVLWPAWTLVVSATPAATARSDPLLTCLAGGVTAYVLTWFAGHPLLVFETAVPFWMALGLLPGMASTLRKEAPEPAAAGRRRRVLTVGLRTATLLAFAIVLSAVPRARAELRRADLSRAVMGFSATHTDPGGRRFRWMARRAQVFVPGDAREVAIPLSSPAGPAVIRLLVDGEVVSRLVVEREWREAVVRLPGDQRRRFVPLELRASVVPVPVSGGDGAPIDTRVRVGTPRILR